MNTTIINQEILLMTTTTFSQKQWSRKEAGEQNDLSQAEQLEEACWNGLLDQLLPGFLKRSVTGKKLFVWQVRQCECCLQIELSSSLPSIVDNEFSIDPYLFFETINNN